MARPDEGFFEQLLHEAFEGVFLIDKQRRIRLWNPAAVHLTGYAAEEVLGRCCSKNILTHLDPEGRKLCRGACPASRTIFDGTPRHAELYLHHKDGHRVPVYTRVLPYRDGAGKVVGAVQLFTPILPEREATIGGSEHPGEVDVQTGVAGGLLLAQMLEARLNELRRFGWPVGVVLVSLEDGLRAIADAHSEESAHAVLRMVARSLVNGLRSFDLVGRNAESELACLVVNVDAEGLAAVAQKLWRLVLESSLEVDGTDLRVTPRMAAVSARVDDDPHTLIARLEEALARGEGGDDGCLVIA